MTNLKSSLGSPLLVFCSTKSGLDIVTGLLENNCNIVAIVGLDPGIWSKKKLHEYFDASIFCKNNNIDFISVTSYDLKNRFDIEKILNIDFDFLLVASWQRLLPKEVLSQSKKLSLGVHGGVKGIEKSRGRSPQNWAMITGAQIFQLSIFKLEAGVDNGSIFNTRTFSYNQFDDIETSYYKVAISVVDMVLEILLDYDSGLKSIPQKDRDAQYYPQRIPEDGAIDWHQKSDIIYDFVRALSKPYPGAFTECENGFLKIWRCQPFDSKIFEAPGTITNIFTSGEFLITTLDGRLLVRKFETEHNYEIKVGMVFKSKNRKEAFRSLLARHNKSHPNQRVSDYLLSFYQEDE